MTYEIEYDKQPQKFLENQTSTLPKEFLTKLMKFYPTIRFQAMQKRLLANTVFSGYASVSTVHYIESIMKKTKS